MSSIYETAPWGYLDQPDVLNCACALSTDLEPLALLGATQAVERELGRRPNFRFGPRLIDVDILICGDTVHSTPDLQIPHPRMAERAFVLVPLSEIAAEVRHPTSGQTIKELAGRVEGKDGVRLWAGPDALLA